MATPVIPVTSIRLMVITDPAPTAPQRFQCAVQLIFGIQVVPLNVETPEEFMAIAAMLQVPGQVLFEQQAGTNRNIVIKQIP